MLAQQNLGHSLSAPGAGKDALRVRPKVQEVGAAQRGHGFNQIAMRSAQSRGDTAARPTPVWGVRAEVAQIHVVRRGLGGLSGPLV